MPQRLVGLLEHDLLQALPLYAFIGALLNRLPLAQQMQRSGMRLFGRSAAAPQLSALGVGALLAPMNGSVGASLHTLSRGVAPALAAAGIAPAAATATVCVASTLGVVIPPSLVLLLLGDAMMRAHTEAVNATHAALRIVNTQDVMRAALLPGLLVLLLAGLLTAWQARRHPPREPAPLAWRDGLAAAAAALVIVALLAGVASGLLYAVEAAASGGLLLVLAALAARQLSLPLLRQVLRDTLTLSGMLFALLVAATSFSLLLRAFGTDQWVAQGLQSLSGQPRLLLAAVLAGLVACAFVLDAFEMIFLVIPLVMPPVLMTVPDAAWVATLSLLVLQAGFLLPPLGYAVVMGRSLVHPAPGLRSLSKALWPFLASQALVIGLVLACPALTQWLRPADATALPAPARRRHRPADAGRGRQPAPRRGPLNIVFPCIHPGPCGVPIPVPLPMPLPTPTRPTRAVQLANFVVFQAAWFAGVLGAAHQVPGWGTAAVLAAIGWHLVVSARPADEARLVALVALIGFVVESLLASQGKVHYASGQPVAWLAPYWMVAMWALLAIALNVTMRWLRGRPWLAALLGAIAGPASFASGVRLGGAQFVDATVALATLAVVWALLMPVLMRLSVRFDGVAVPERT